MVLLLLASVWSWAVIIDKTFRLARPGAQGQRASSGNSGRARPLDDLYRQLAKRPDHPMALMFATAMEEWRESPRDHGCQPSIAAWSAGSGRSWT